MRKYASITTSIWRSQKIRSLKNSDRPRLLYFYFHTAPQCNSVGCYSLPIGYIATDLGWGEQQVSEAIDSLCEVKLVEWNDHEHLVRIVDFVIHDPPTNPKHAIAFVLTTFEIPDCQEKLNLINELMAVPYCDNDPRLKGEFERLCKAYRKPLETQSLSLTRSLTLSQDSPSLRSGVSAKPKAKKQPESPGFSEFYAIYPRHEARSTASKAYTRAVQVADAKTILDGARRYADHRRGQDPKYTKHPATWLNGGCWADELPGIANGLNVTNGSHVEFEPCGEREWIGRLNFYFENPEFEKLGPGHRWAKKWGPPPTDETNKIPPAVFETYKSRIAAERIKH